MSRCYACNNILSKQEACRRFSESNTFTELCNKCLTTLDDDELALEEGNYEEDEENEE